MQCNEVSWAICLLNFDVYICKSLHNQWDPSLKPSDFLSGSTLPILSSFYKYTLIETGHTRVCINGLLLYCLGGRR